MISREQSVEIHASVRDCYEICFDVGGWPRYMPAVKSAKKIEGDDRADVVEITAEAGSDMLTWRSRRRLKVEEGRIYFHRIDPAPPFTRMQGCWMFRDAGDRTVVTLRHEYDLVADADPAVAEAMIAKNVDRDMEGMKATLEGRGQ